MRFTMLLCVFLLAGCVSNAPPSLSPASVTVWQANEIVVAINGLQRTAIELNKVQRCEAPPSTVCAPVLSDRNTGVVVDAVTDALTTIRTVPAGWKATGLAALQRIELRLDGAGKAKLAAYVGAARTIIESL